MHVTISERRAALDHGAAKSTLGRHDSRSPSAALLLSRSIAGGGAEACPRSRSPSAALLLSSCQGTSKGCRTFAHRFARGQPPSFFFLARTKRDSISSFDFPALRMRAPPAASSARKRSQRFLPAFTS